MRRLASFIRNEMTGVPDIKYAAKARKGPKMSGTAVLVECFRLHLV
jgi:hypothetical protein